MDTDTILGFLDEGSRLKVFHLCFTKLEVASSLDLDVLRVCIRLRPPLESAAKLIGLVLLRIPEEPQDSDRIYKLAEVLLSDGDFAYVLLGERLHAELVALLPELSRNSHGDREASGETELSYQHGVRKATAYLKILKCSYWLPSRQNHVVDPGSLELLSRFLGIVAVDEAAHDTVSAFLSLLKRGESIVVAHPRITLQSWLQYDDSTLGQMVLVGSIIDQSIWDRFRALGSPYFNASASKIFRTWFQWVSQAVIDGIRLECLNDNIYWERLRVGLLTGYADQRKFCIGIIRQSLLAAHSDISTPMMRFAVADRARYLNTYGQYSSLFETIVLNRYSNQVQACLPELSKLFRTDVTPVMATTLLSAALHSTVQESVRKIVGKWYIDYVVKDRGNCDGHLSFLLEGFLPWATIGELFTSTLTPTRATTYSAHGAALANVIAMFVSENPDTASLALSASSDFSDSARVIPTRRAVLHGVLDFILEARGNIFQFSILYLLEGLAQGLRACRLPLQEPLAQPEIDKILQVSRFPGLPEIANDLNSEYCLQICEFATPGWLYFDMTGCGHFRARALQLQAPMEPTGRPITADLTAGDLPPLKALLEQLEESSHSSIQGDQYAPACKDLVQILDRIDYVSISHTDLYAVLDAFWEEADRRQFCRPVAVNIPPLLFHPTCIRACIMQESAETENKLDESLRVLLSKAMDHLQRLSEGRSYILTVLAASLRKAAFSNPEILNIIPFEDYILRFVNLPPSTKPEFLFEIAAAEKLQLYQPHRTYVSYYGEREWHAYAATIDLIQRFPIEQVSVAKHILDHLLEPWRTQRPGVPVISKWKNVLQLQAMLLLAEFAIPESEVDAYLVSFKHALVLEAWPRYRFLLEWIIARLYHKFPGKTTRILDDLTNLDDNSSTHIASLMKLAVLVAPHETEAFSAKLMTQLVPFSASPKVHIRHESNYAIPIMFDLALSKGWESITHNHTFLALDAFIRRLEKFQSAPWTIRTLKRDAVEDFTLVNIFQGQYLTIESPEKERVAYADFLALQEADRLSGLRAPTQRIPLGTPHNTESITANPASKTPVQHLPEPAPQSSPAYFQTKSGFDIDSLYPPSGPPSVQNQRPASVILVASLIDNPTNIGGLSRISESFGLQALYIDNLKKTAHKDFKATSVTSEKHFPIHELKIASVPEFLMEAKRDGYEVVGIEQTDRSGILGTEGEGAGAMNTKDLGTLPKKCVLVLGSEKGGITAEVLAVVDRCVEIRTVGVTRSLNVQTAGGIALYEWWREWGIRS